MPDTESQQMLLLELGLMQGTLANPSGTSLYLEYASTTWSTIDRKVVLGIHQETI
jgi:nicotinamide mononucleotide (NMN) deamidase PncC